MKAVLATKSMGIPDIPYTLTFFILLCGIEQRQLQRYEVEMKIKSENSFSELGLGTRFAFQSAVLTFNARAC